MTEGRPKPGAQKRVLCSFGVDVDAVAGWLGSYGGEDSPNDISRGVFAGEVGSLRLLKLFEKYNIKTTWFIPGHSLDTFPEEMAKVRDAGHEIGLHGYSHEASHPPWLMIWSPSISSSPTVSSPPPFVLRSEQNPVEMTFEQQKEVLDHTFKQLTEFCGKPPKGSVAPWWETSAEGTELLLDYGIEYDHSNMHHDCQMYYLRDEDKWTKIDYKAKSAGEWMKPLTRGNETGLVEIPASWYLDDLPPMMFIKDAPNSHGWVDVRSVEQLWKDQFEYFYREYDHFVFPLTIHPDVSGRPHVLLMLERLIEWINKHEGVEWVTMQEMNEDFRKRNPPKAGVKLPKALSGI